MCIVFVLRGSAIPSHLNYKLIIAANRDEFVDRKTLPLDIYQKDRTTILAGRDVDTGGTWLGINQRGVVVALTNNREVPFNRMSGSRGKLPNLILAAQTPRQAIDQITTNIAAYSNFNLIAIDSKSSWIYYIGTNDLENPEGREVIEDAFSISNGTIDSKWPKMQNSLVSILDEVKNSSNQEGLVSGLLGCLLDSQTYSYERLPTNTIMSQRSEALLSSVFVSPCNIKAKDPKLFESEKLFATVSSSIILVQENSADFYEISWRECTSTDSQKLSNHFDQNHRHKRIVFY